MINRRSFIIGLKGTKINTNEKKFLKKFKPWGIILFSRNIKNIYQTRKLTNNIREIFKDKNYPIMIDQEGGKINRLKNLISFDNLTSEYFGNLYVKNKKEFNILYKLYIDKTSFILERLGININTVPVLDLRYKGSSNVIGDRSFSKDPKTVSKIGDFCINHFKNNSIGTIIKHIPGHGLAKVDSHYFTPIIKKSLSYLKKRDFVPFKNKNVFFAMTAHVRFEKIDSINTVTHSKKIIQLIRNQIQYKNILISDDLSMKSLKLSLKQNTINTFKAGCNLALHCNGNLKEMNIVAKNSPKLSSFVIKKTSQFYKILS
tara:strand:- start:1374 stop:2321 length:948 start_codon:yes stop_codon:yes gene_type:complete